ncbi:MAG: hypothetical protein ACLQLR_01465 [Methanoregula sp.]
MSLVSFCGKVAITVSILIVIAALVLGALLVVCVGIGAYESAANPHIQQDTARDYSNVTNQIARGTTGLSGAVRNITGG